MSGGMSVRLKPLLNAVFLDLNSLRNRHSLTVVWELAVQVLLDDLAQVDFDASHARFTLDEPHSFIHR